MSSGLSGTTEEKRTIELDDRTPMVAASGLITIFCLKRGCGIDIDAELSVDAQTVFIGLPNVNVTLPADRVPALIGELTLAARDVWPLGDLGQDVAKHINACVTQLAALDAARRRKT